MKQEYVQERNPSDVLHESPEETTLPETVLQEGEANVTRAIEHDCSRKPDLETVQIVPIHWELESEQDVVDDTNRDRASDTVYVDGESAPVMYAEHE